MLSNIENGLDVLRREAKGARGKRKSWKFHNRLMRQAQEHIEHCGGCWEDYSSSLSREFAELLKL